MRLRWVAAALFAMALAFDGFAQVPTVWEAAKYFQYNIDAVAVGVDPTTGSRNVSVVFSVTDPTLPGHAWNIKTDAPFTQPPSLSRLAVNVAWSTASYHNTGSANAALTPIPAGNGAGAALPTSVNALTRSVALGDKWLVQIPLPPQAVNSGTVVIEGRLAWTTEVNGVPTLGRVPVQSASRHFAITGSSVVPRRQIVSVAKCQSCHDGKYHGGAEIPRLSLHGNNRTEDLTTCATCHNPNQTDVPYRLAGAEQSIDFTYMIHSIHGTKRRLTPYKVVGYGGTEHDFSTVRFPGTVANCTTCHVDVNRRGTYEFPLSSAIPGTTINTRSVLGSTIDVDPANNLRITPMTAACSSCHDSDKARRHMAGSRQGGSFSVLQADIASGRVRERCVDCHGAGKEKDVRRVHQIGGR